jgi:type I restriction enzyme S subunit
MIADLKPYPEYKESGSRWLAKVPSYWEVRNLRTLIRPRNERSRADLPLLSVAREKGVFVRSLTDTHENHNVIPEDLSNYKVARAGSLVINKMKAWQGSMGIAPCDGIVSPAYFVFDFGIANRAFGQALLRSKPYVAHFGQASDGVRVGQWDLTIAGMRQIPVLVPPPAEQAAIVRFLDWANGRLERAIRAKRKVIALLTEQKQAIIHRAVTRGLDPSVPLKPSGIPWLGDIPQHWGVVRNMALFSHRVEQGIPGLPVLQVSLHSGITSEDFDQFGRPKRLIADHTKYKLVRKHDLAYNTMRMWQGAVGVSASDGLVSPAYVVIRPRTGIDPYFYEFVFRTAVYKQQVNRHSTGIVSDRNRLYWESFKQMPNVVLPVGEQQAICRFIQEKTGSLNTAITRLEREIELLREYRTRLVADVVTGKFMCARWRRVCPRKRARWACRTCPTSPTYTTCRMFRMGLVNPCRRRRSHERFRWGLAAAWRL